MRRLIAEIGMRIWLLLICSSAPLFPVRIFLIKHLYSLLTPAPMSLLSLVCQVLHYYALAGPLWTSLPSHIFFLVRVRVRFVSQIDVFHIGNRIPTCGSLRISSTAALISSRILLVLPIYIIILIAVFIVPVLSASMFRRVLPASHICNIGRNLNILLFSLTSSPSSSVSRFATSNTLRILIFSSSF